jgi:rfaE bifunctional protein nucleotidyltransferase chain/domain
MALINGSDRKIRPLVELAKTITNLKAEGKCIVQCHGVFDLVHPGHIRLLEAAKQEGDVLVVTVTPDKYVNKGPGRPVFNQRLRAETLAALQCVDFVAINEWPTAIETIRLLKPDVYVKGCYWHDL